MQTEDRPSHETLVQEMADHYEDAVAQHKTAFGDDPAPVTVEMVPIELQCVARVLRAAASALPDEPSTDVWSEWEGLRDAYAKAYRWQALPVGPHGEAPHTTATRTALDTFFRRCIGVRREPDAYTLTFDSKFSASKRCRALFMDGNGLKTSFGTLGQVQERAGNFFDRNPRIEGVYIDRAPVTPDDTRRMEVSDTLKARLEAAWREGFGAGRDFAFNVAYNTPTHGEEARWTDSDTREAASALPDEPSAPSVRCDVVVIRGQWYIGPFDSESAADDANDLLRREAFLS